MVRLEGKIILIFKIVYFIFWLDLGRKGFYLKGGSFWLFFIRNIIRLIWGVG